MSSLSRKWETRSERTSRERYYPHQMFSPWDTFSYLIQTHAGNIITITFNLIKWIMQLVLFYDSLIGLVSVGVPVESTLQRALTQRHSRVKRRTQRPSKVRVYHDAINYMSLSHITFRIYLFIYFQFNLNRVASSVNNLLFLSNLDFKKYKQLTI